MLNQWWLFRLEECLGEQVDFGTYPFVTSSNPSIGGVASGLGLAPTKFGAIIGVVRSPAGRTRCCCFQTAVYHALLLTTAGLRWP